MRNAIAQTSNLKRLLQAAHGLLFRSPGTPGIGLVSGPVGLGKTTSAKHICLLEAAVWVEALPDWSPNWMLGDLAIELGAERAHATRVNFERVLGALRERPRAIFIDEADRLVDRLRMVETLRSIHDQTQAPLVLIGMSKLSRVVQSLPQLSSRVAQWIEFGPCDLRDVRTLATTLCEIELADDLIRRLHEETRGSARAIRVALERIERLARRRGKQRVGASDLPEGFEFAYALRSTRSVVDLDSVSEERAASHAAA